LFRFWRFSSSNQVLAMAWDSIHIPHRQYQPNTSKLYDNRTPYADETKEFHLKSVPLRRYPGMQLEIISNLLLLVKYRSIQWKALPLATCNTIQYNHFCNPLGFKIAEFFLSTLIL
jgi:hypothetical protein